MSTRPWFLCRLWGRILFSLTLASVASSPWPPLADSCEPPVSASIFSVRVSVFSLLLRMPVIRSGSTLTQCDLILTNYICKHPISKWSPIMLRYWLPRRRSRKASACLGRRRQRCRFSPWARKIPWSRKWPPTLVFLPGKSLGKRSMVGYSPWCCRVRHDWSNLVSACTHTHTYTHIHSKVLTHVIMEAEKVHNLPPASWRLRKASGIGWRPES